MKHPVRLAPKADNELTVRDPGCLTGYAKHNYLGDVMRLISDSLRSKTSGVGHERQTAAVKSQHVE